MQKTHKKLYFEDKSDENSAQVCFLRKIQTFSQIRKEKENRQTDRYCYYFVDKEHSGGSMLPWHLRYFVLYSFLRRLCRKRRKRCRKIHIYILFNVLSINKWSNLIGRCILGITRFYVFLFAANNYTGCSTYNPLKTIRFWDFRVFILRRRKTLTVYIFGNTIAIIF